MDALARPFEPPDLSAVVEVIDRAMQADSLGVARFTRQVLLDPNFRSEGAIVAGAGGKTLGFCLSLARHAPLENAPSDVARGYITLMGVAPERQRQRIGTALLNAAENYLRSQQRKLVMISPYAPGYFLPGVDVNAYRGALSFFTKHGYREVYRPLAMQAPLWELKVPHWVRQREDELKQQGVRIENYHPQLTLPVLDFTQNHFAGDWVRVVRETMGRIVAGDSSARLIVAHENGQVLGFSHYENERFGPIGVAPAARGRGIGQVLMFRTLEAQRIAGFRAAWFLWSDDKTADKIYNAAGFKEVRRFAVMKKEL